MAIDKSVLDELNNVFQKVEDSAGGFEDLPDGDYLVEITGVESKISASSNRPMIQISTKVLAGEHENKRHNRFMMLDGKDQNQLNRNLTAVATQAKAFDIDTSGGLAKTIESLGELVGKEAVAKIHTIKFDDGGEFTTTMINPAEE